MNKILGIAVLFVFLFSCRDLRTDKTENSEITETQEVRQVGYALSKPTGNIKAVLVLFGGFPEKAEDIKREFKILDFSKTNGVAVVFLNYNQRLWLEENEKQKLRDELQNIFRENDLPSGNTYFGGFSSGGNLALLISDFLTRQNSDISPKGVFIVDSPIDLMALYESSQKNIARNFSEISVKESKWLIGLFEKQLGDPKSDISKYQEYSVYTSKTNNIDNLKNLKNTRIRFYSEPDTIWWKEHRMADYDQLNAYYLKQLSETLKKSGFTKVEFITTKNKGYRANGKRHPHSWSIVDTKELIKWIRN